MAVINKPDMNYGIWAENGNVEIPSSEKVELGWIAEKPLNEQMNWVQNRQDAMLQYINQHGIVEWDNVTEYPINAFVAREGVVYKALSQNVDKDPTLNTAIWTVAFADFSVATTVDKILNEDGFVEHYVRKSAPVLNATAKGVGYNNSVGISGLSFEGNTPIITNSSHTVAEFSGGKNPKDVVTHEQLRLAIQVYQVGDIYITTSGENPTQRFGYGVWERFAEGRTLVGYSTRVTSDTPDWVKTVEKEFGEYDHKLTTEELPNHKHNMEFDAFSEANGGSTSKNGFVIPVADTPLGFKTNTDTITSTGGDKTHNNVQPSIVVVIWRRVA